MKIKNFWMKLDGGLAPDDPSGPLLLARQLHAYFSVVPVAVGGNIFNAFVVAIFAYGAVPHPLLAAWVALIAGISLIRLRSWRNHVNQPGVRNPHQTLFHITTISLITGSAWGAAVAWMLVFTPSSIFVPTMVAAGMMNAGASMLNAVPKAAIAFIAPIALGASCGLATMDATNGFTAAALLLAYCVVLGRSIDAAFSNLVSRTLHEYQLVEQADTVKLLLHDYQEHSSDWLWVVDAGGRLDNVSQRFAEAAQRPAETLAGGNLLDLFDDCPEVEILKDYIASLRSFSDLTLPLTIGGEQHWWTLCAHPRLNSDRSTVIGLRGVATNVTAARRAEAKVAYMAHYDGLTDLPNRFLFNETLQRALNRRKAGQVNAVLCLDLDQFKAVNDTLGHPVGDKLLQTVARRLENCVRAQDLPARLGGDEFAVLLSDVDGKEEASALAERIIAAVAEPIDIDGQHILTATSIGIALAPDNGNTVSDLLKNADLALYDAKANGRSRFSFFESGMDAAARERRELEMELRGALSKNELNLHYQPLINIETGTVSGYEALMRWSHPERGVVSPTEFIPIAEETGLIIQLGEWVIRRAIAEVASWPEHLHVAVNLSPLQMRSASLISTIINALGASGVSPRRLELEITENVLMHDTDVNIATLHRLRNLGVRISLDDFGTGYSSLNYLRSFPFDKIKIDRCFIESIDTSDDCRAIVASVTGLAKRLGMITTAEGVERPEQLAELASGGCTEAQGFLFSKAVPSEELTDLRSRTPNYPRHLEAAHVIASQAEQTMTNPRRRRKA